MRSAADPPAARERTARDRLREARRLREDGRLSEAALLACEIRAAGERQRWPGVSVRVCGRRVAVTWGGAPIDREQVVTYLWRNGWNVAPPVRRFGRGRHGVYVLPGTPLIVRLAEMFASEIDGYAAVKRVGVNKARVATDYGSADLVLSDDQQRVHVDFRESRDTRQPYHVEMWVSVANPRDRFYAMARRVRW